MIDRNKASKGNLKIALWIAFMLGAIMLFAGCEISITDTTEHTIYLCIVDGDTISVPNDTTGTRCASPSALDSINLPTQGN